MENGKIWDTEIMTPSHDAFEIRGVDEESSDDHADELADSSYSQSYESQCESTYVFGQCTDEDITSPKKRRKIDKDGFLCPATPDIPKTSCHYGQPRHNQHESQESDTVQYEQPYETSNIQALSEDISTPPDTENQLALNDVSAQHAEDNKDRSRMPIDQVIKDLGQESKMLYSQWANMFRESENFETFCPVRLDKMIQQAKQLEESLLKQKQLLCTRLNVISHIIRTSITEGPRGDH